MAEETDIFGNEIPDEDPEGGDALTDDTEDSIDDDGEDEELSPEDSLTADGDEPDDIESVRKYWQGAYTKSRQKDRERYGKIEDEHQQYQQLLANFYQNDDYAMQVIRQRFPNLAGQLSDRTGQAPKGSPEGQSSDVTTLLQQSLSEIGLGDVGLDRALGKVLDRLIEDRVTARIQPLEQRTRQQTEEQRRTERERLLAEMDGKYPGWEESFRPQMDEIQKFLSSEQLHHPKFGNKFELMLRLVNPDAARSDAIRAMGEAARRRTGVSRGGRGGEPNIAEQVRKAESSADAFKLAAKAASEDLG